MAVPVDKRSQGTLAVNTKANALVVYTIKILENEKWFPQKHSKYIEKLQDCAIEIACLCWEANNIRVDNDAEKYKKRIDLQESAVLMCGRFQVMIEIAKLLFHLESKRVIHWVSEVNDLRTMIRAWHDKDITRLRPKEQASA